MPVETPVLSASPPTDAAAILERDGIVAFPAPATLLSEEDRALLLSQRQGASRFHKNVSYRPARAQVRGLADASARAAMQAVMGRWCQRATALLGELVPRYAGAWSLDYASFRPIEEEGRDLPVVRRNDLVHVDAFPTRPTQGRRILRVFLNIAPAQPRIWRTGPPFAEIAQAHAHAAGLARLHRPLARARDAALRRLAPLLPGGAQRRRSPYDRLMLRLHDHLKQDADFQASCAARTVSFPSGTCWVVFTDAVAHAVLSGCFALEQTVIVPLAAMQEPERAPIRVLERLAGLPLG